MLNRKCKHRLKHKGSTMEMIDVSDDDKYIYETYECYVCNKTKVCRGKI